MKHRKERIASAIQEAASKYLADKKYGDSMVTVTSVSLNDDLSRANIKVTIYPDSDSENVLKKLNRGRGLFAKYTKEHTRISLIPLFSFSIDKGELHRQRIDDISRDLK